jgi:hypothetical protein
MVADSVKFGEWSLPVNYTRTPTGGSCAPGCHKPEPYDREVPGRMPPNLIKPATDAKPYTHDGIVESCGMCAAKTIAARMPWANPSSSTAQVASALTAETTH